MEVLNTTVDLGTLRGKSALITGGASGIGLATARAWAAAGMYVTIADIQPLETGQNILADLAGGHVHYVCCDVTSWESQIKAFKEAIQFTPSKALDIVAAFAGVSFAGGNQVDHVLAAGDPRLDVNPSPPDIRNIQVNLIGVYYTSWLGLYYLRLPPTNKAANPSPDKSLILMGSIGSYMDSPKASTYPASKFGVRGLFRSTRARTRELGVRCNLLAPWFIDTPLIAPMKKAMAARGIDMAQRLTFASVDACVEAATTCAANPQLHGTPPMRCFVEDLGQTPCLPGKDLDSILAGWGQLAGTLATRYGFPPPDESVTTEDVQLDGLWLRCYTPPKATGQEPVGLYFHGGGWVMGGVNEEDGFCRVISRQCQMRLVSVEYRKAPETRYPGALNDGVIAALWALSRYENQPLILMGTSAGGNLAFGTALRLIDQDMADKVSGVVALAPITVHPDAVPEHLKEQYTAYEENAELTVNSRAAMQVFFDCYKAPVDDVYTSCLLHPRLLALPKVYIAELGLDTLRDDARLMKGALDTAKVPVMYDAYPGFPHCSFMFPFKSLGEHQRTFFGGVAKAVRWMS
ncbi:Alpha/Beta hydrolase protein [Aspergillus flavus]|uniref:Alpha/Beta hydrolase protein n=2 Tax=Aspergillus subgen. Circumdati TaxID=2720871 RepID=A0A5N6GJ01_ASPFL|nr:Alpha/Beta hydrolase protein [Aspergillus flavus]